MSTPPEKNDISPFDGFKDAVAGFDGPCLTTFLHFARAASSVSLAFDSFLKTHGLLQGRFLALLMLNSEPEGRATHSHLARSCGVTPATMTTFVDGLERDGLVVRKTRTDDRRRVEVALTPAGVSRLASLMPACHETIVALLAPLSPAERALVDGWLVSVASRAQATLEKPRRMETTVTGG